MDLLTSYRDNCGFGLVASIKNIPSHKNLEDAITALERMMHRGAIAADGKSGDGSGLLLSMPHKFMKKVAQEHNVVLPDIYGVAMLFMSDFEKEFEVFSEICDKNDLRVLFFREVPINIEALGELALKTLPKIIQIFVAPNSLMATKKFDSNLYLTRKEIVNSLKESNEFYICSFSSKVISYKGLVMPTHIKEFYEDLDNESFEISFALFHQRFSTNTLPKWKLAQPFRTIAHNGEINSVTANRYNVQVKSEVLKSEIFSSDEISRILPILDKDVSDSASLDNFFEFLTINGIDFFKAARFLIPAPWQNAPYMDAKLRAFYEYGSTCFEAWDGPAAVSLTDGRYIGCVLDRNGLRPAKYIITKDDRLLIASEYGVLDIDEDNVLERGRLQSGEMIGLDLKFGKILKNEDINDYLKNSNPYATWLNQNMVYLQEHFDTIFEDFSDYTLENLESKQRYFNITNEVIDQVIKPMAQEGKEAVGSMGDDTPIVAFSNSLNRNFSDFFRQKFAQVTNPPIDPYREKVVMSLNAGFGEIHNIIDENPNHSLRLKSVSPILMKENFDVILSYGDPKKARFKECYRYKIFSTAYKSNLKGSLEDLIYEIVESVKNSGVRIIILDDRAISSELKTIPMVMAIGRLNYALLDAKIRHLVSIIAVSGEAVDAHSNAVMIGYGASAIYPYMLYSTVYNMIKKDNLSSYEIKTRLKNVRNALNLGLLKVMSKMGISTLASYRSSALFDVIGLSKELCNECFRDSISLLNGLDYRDIEIINDKKHKKAYENIIKAIFPLEIGGFYKFLSNGEYHDFAPDVIFSIHKSSISGKENDYLEFSNRINLRDKKMIRDFFEISSDKKAIDISEVEGVEAIFKRFASAAMSLGSISPEAHEAIAEAMNKIGGQSNSGEGGEDPKRYGTIKNSKIKQVASGRFGVTPEYLVNAEEIQIKLAQGAKPGEGGQLPGHKVTPLIASLRYTVPGVTLISPPPHHDIYSIEDLAQLIFDLKQVNPKAKVTVKLVSTAGVGTIAAGVAKAYADKIIISGSDGGTGAAPLSSIKFAGNPWELGLSEAHNALKVNHLRESVHLQTDGGLKTGLDVIKATLLGAESYGFGTAVLAVLGCKMLRVCHLNRCTVGVATQDERLRDHFVGTVERLINYFTLVAQEVRTILAKMGYKSLGEIVGRSELLKVIDDEFAKKFDFSSILRKLDGVNICQKESNEPFDKNQYEKEILKQIYYVIENPENSVVLDKTITNLNRSFGARISGEIARFYGNKGLKNDTIKINLRGTAGQSFGAFLINGVSLYLRGVANDYVGKGMNGGKIVITPKNQGEKFSSAGNTCLYGATGGKLFVTGSVGERFAVRNSGALAVVEGTGDHACEYMTGGVVVILGKTGVNFGAGMTGGVAFVYDVDRIFMDKINQELIEASRIDTDLADEERHYLKKLLKQYLNETKSQKANYILENFRDEVRNFWIIKPKNMKKVPLNPNEGD